MTEHDRIQTKHQLYLLYCTCFWLRTRGVR